MAPPRIVDLAFVLAVKDDLRVRARLLSGEEAVHAGRALVRKHRIVHGILVPLAHRLRGYKTVHFELMPIDGGIP